MRRWGKPFALVATLLVAAARLWPQAAIQAVTDNISYNVGDEVYLDVIFPSADAGRSPDGIRATVRYAGESAPLLNRPVLSLPAKPSGRKYSTGFLRLWKIPTDARTGRYEIDISVRGASSEQAMVTLPRVASFVVHRKLVQINQVALDKSIYTVGDPIGCRVTLTNLSDRPLTGLRIEFSERYWPWIAPSSERAGIDVETLAEGFTLPASESKEITHPRAAVVRTVGQPTTQQYAVVVWDRERKAVFDIAFSSPVVIRSPGVESPKPYPLHYVYQKLGDLHPSSYRQFYPAELTSPAIQFDRSHTMFPAGGTADVRFSVTNPSLVPWHGFSILARLLNPEGKELTRHVVEESLNLEPGKSAPKKATKLALPAEASGIYRAVIELREASGQILASNSFELGVNPLPKSIVIFCAHEDDEGAHAGIIRAAVENRIPLHIVYFTSGDAGSCDRYYQHSCDPAEALNFGALRMEEARAALGHLGVTLENIHFFGLPDGGLGQIWRQPAEAANPYLSVLLASDHAPYEGLVQSNLPYALSPVIQEIKEFVKRFQPQVIYTGHPDERHVDHRTNNWLVVKALQGLVPEGAISPKLTLLVDQVYGPGPQTPAPYRYQKHVLHVSGEAMALAQEAQWFYQSQSGNRALGRLRTFDRLPRTETHWQILDWNEHEGWNEKIESLGD